MKLRWDPCVVQEAEDLEAFFAQWVDKADKRCLLIGGAGFDPRATLIPKRFSALTKCQTEGIFFREERILDQPLLRPCADKNEAVIKELLGNTRFPKIEIFSEGVTAVGGRRALAEFASFSFDVFTDIFVDISALSCGVFFSLVRFLVDVCDQNKNRHLNLHLLVVEQPLFDLKIQGIPADTAAMLHGFKGDRSLDGSWGEALLWIPSLSMNHGDSLTKIYQFIQRTDTPIDVCPIVPFPGLDPRMPDRLVEEYREHLDTWRADHRNFLYSAESDPLDSYRSISNLVAARSEIFAGFGGSQVVLSPLGNKMLSVGVLLAAVEMNLPVVMVESIGYDEAQHSPGESGPSFLKHVWLCGEAYA